MYVILDIARILPIGFSLLAASLGCSAQESTSQGLTHYRTDLMQRGIEVVVLENKECQDLMKAFIEKKPETW